MKIRGVACPSCKEWIWSRHRHDFRSCSCGSVSIDGGQDKNGYTRVVTADNIGIKSVKQSTRSMRVKVATKKDQEKQRTEIFNFILTELQKAQK